MQLITMQQHLVIRVGSLHQVRTTRVVVAAVLVVLAEQDQQMVRVLSAELVVLGRFQPSREQASPMQVAAEEALT